ncbi:MAG: zf-HC2 domain-containing protein [Lachnospiraceae bacterium]|nr:zf-HC2 domain-containing protein [Lachnospiraceae bacterium]
MKKVRELSCAEAQKLIQPYINAKLSDSECEAFLAHVHSCPDCYDELETYFIIYFSLKYLDDDSKNTSYDLRKILKDQIKRNEASIQAGKMVVRFSNVLLVISETLVAFTAVMRMKPGLLIFIRYWLYRFYLFLMN